MTTAAAIVFLRRLFPNPAVDIGPMLLALRRARLVSDV
jgi:hypothetical protein